MFKKISLIFFCFFAGNFLAGCALTNETVPLNYYPQPQFGQLATQSKNTLRIGEVIDTRGGDPALLMHKINGNNQTASGMYLANQPVATILRDALKTALGNANYRIVKQNPKYVLTAELISLDFQFIQSWFNSNLATNLKINFNLKNFKTGNIVWNQILNGQSNTPTPSGFALDSTPEWLSKGFTQAANDLISKLETSAAFRQALQQ